MKHSSLLPIISIMSVVSLMGFGCNPIESAKEKIQDKVSEEVGDAVAGGVLSKATGGQVNVDSGNEQVSYKDNKTGNSMVYGENVTIPEDFPKDVPIYPGAVAKSIIITKTGDQSTSITLESTDATSKVLAWYENSFKTGWTEDSSMTASGTEIRGYSTSGTKLALSISPKDEEGGSLITLVRTTSTE